MIQCFGKGVVTGHKWSYLSVDQVSKNSFYLFTTFQILDEKVLDRSNKVDKNKISTEWNLLIFFHWLYCFFADPILFSMFHCMGGLLQMLTLCSMNNNLPRLRYDKNHRKNMQAERFAHSAEVPIFMCNHLEFTNSGSCDWLMLLLSCITILKKKYLSQNLTRESTVGSGIGWCSPALCLGRNRQWLLETLRYMAQDQNW